MNRYTIHLNCYATTDIEVLAENKEEALQKAKDMEISPERFDFVPNEYSVAAEECGCDYYVTNDSEGTTFERYYLDASEEPLYYATLEEACRYISELTCIEVKTVCEIDKALERYREGLSDDEWIYFHKFELIED